MPSWTMPTEPPDPKRSPAVVRLAVSFAATSGLALALVIWSESWFYGRWRSEDSVLGFVETLVAYGLAVQVVRFVTFRWMVAATGAGAWKRVFLAGALYGWLVEGVIVTTVIDDLPLSLSYTGLAWHALFTVLLGWWWVPRVLQRRSFAAIARLAALGAGVGLWASFWRFEEGAVTSVVDFAVFATLTTVVYAAGLAIWWSFRGRANPGLPGSAVAIALLLALAVLNGISNPLTLIGPALAGLALLALVLTKPGQTDAALLPIAGPAPWRALWRLFVIPIVATGMFGLATSAPEAIPTGWLFYIVTVPLGVVLFVLAWWRARPRAPRG